MLGSIIGDIIGSVYEFANTERYDFEAFADGSDFTDDTVLSVAVADAILQKRPYGELIREYGLKYPHRGYGMMFGSWLRGDVTEPYNSFGNGSAMRASAVGWAFGTIEETLSEAEKSAACTHDHPEGIKGAQATAAAVFMARHGSSKAGIKEYIEKTFSYDLSRSLAEIRPGYSFDETCQKTVPEAITCFLESESYEDAVRKAIWLGGDSDTLACITGGMAEAFYRQIPASWAAKAMELLPKAMIPVVRRFRELYC